VIAAVAVRLAGAALLFDVGQLAARGELTVAADYTAARQRPKPKEPHQTHCLTLPMLRRGSKACTAEIPSAFMVRTTVNNVNTRESEQS
jgi:hypothetical protein